MGSITNGFRANDTSKDGYQELEEQEKLMKKRRSLQKCEQFKKLEKRVGQEYWREKG